MGTSFDDYLADSEKVIDPEVAAAAAVFRPQYQLAVQLIELRDARGLSQSELARRTGVDQSEISRIERGAGNPTIRTLSRLADALDVDLQFVDRS